MGHIYEIINKTNGKIYIGQTTRSIEKRLEEHRTGKTKGCRAIYNAIKFHGWDNFETDWYECPDEDLNFDEELLVKEMDTMAPRGYNLREGGGSHGKMSEESKQKNREAHIGKSINEETRKKISETTKGDKNHNYGKSPNEESKQKMSEAKQGETNYKSKRVYQYACDGTFIESFASIGEAGRYIQKDGTHISACARGVPKYKTAYGFKWSYIKF